MATQTITNVPLPQGTTTFPAASTGWSLPTTGNMRVSIDATTAPASAIITVAIERSADGGLTFGDDVAFTIQGGPHTNKHGGATWDQSTDWAGGHMRVLVTTNQASTIGSVSITTP